MQRSIIVTCEEKPEKYILIITHLVKKVKTQFDNKVETQFQEYIQNTTPRVIEGNDTLMIHRVKYYKL